MLKKKLLSLLLLVSMVLGSYKGYIALFIKDAEEPRQIFPCAVSSLPPADQQALEKGIPVRTQEQLEQLLEDYLS